MNCLTAKACGRGLPLLSIGLQGCTSFRHLSLHSVHCQPPASATHARALPFIPLRSCLPSVSFRSPLAFLPMSRNTKPKRQATFHALRFAICHSVTTLAFPTQLAICPAKCSPLKTKDLKIPRHPLMVQENEEHWRNSFSMATYKILFHNTLLLSRFFSLFAINPNSIKNRQHVNELLFFGSMAA